MILEELERMQQEIYDIFDKHKAEGCSECGYCCWPAEDRRDILQRIKGKVAEIEACKHNYIPTNRTLSNGAMTTYALCTVCGHCRAIKKQKCDVDFIDVHDYKWRAKNFLFALESEKRMQEQPHAEVLEYSEYLKTDKWRALRKKVMTRCNGMCEGCMSKPVHDVHHLTYSNIYDELLFQLVGLCRDCHEKAHGLKGGAI